MARTVKKADEHKGELIDIATQLFLSNGYARTTIKDIYTTTGGSFGMLYHHFQSKEDIFEEKKRLGSSEQAPAIFSNTLPFICLVLGADQAVFQTEAGSI